MAGSATACDPNPPHPFAKHRNLVAPYCAIPRDYLSDTPLLRAMGVLVSQHGQVGAIPPPPFLSVSWRACEVEVRYPPAPQEGYLSDTCAIPSENKANGCDTPLCDTISKGYYAMWGGGISHWAAKHRNKSKITVLQELRSSRVVLSKKSSFSKEVGVMKSLQSETGRIQFRGVRCRTPNSVSFFGLTELRGANSVSSSRRTRRVCPKTQ